MQFLSSVLAGISEVVEYEGRCLRASALATARAIAWIALAAVAAAAGLMLFLYGVYIEGSRLFGAGMGAFLASLTALLIAIAVSLSGRVRPRA